MADPSGKLDHDDGEGLDEKSFLRAYRKTNYPRPSVTVDLVIFTVRDTDLKVLLVKRKGHPYKGCWALPGGFVDVGDAFEDQGEDVETAAHRELEEETGLPAGSCYLEQLYTFGKAGRDPRTRVISVAYFALVRPDLMAMVTAGSDAEEARWLSVESEVDPSTLAFDHTGVLRAGVERIRGKIDYSPIAFSLVPETFTTSDLREVYGAIKGQQYDAGNFRRRFRRMLEDGIIEEAPGHRGPGNQGGRPAKVYRFRRS
jgi:8-oxo-dGTP diphosphatase